MGRIKSVRPELHLPEIDRTTKESFRDVVQKLKRQKSDFHVKVANLRANLKCHFCGGTVHDESRVLGFVNFERFFCCTECRASYKQ